MISLARAAWTGCRYLDAAEVGAGMAWDAAAQCCVERRGVVVVTVTAKGQER